MATFKIHPAIGIARLGDGDEFYLAPEQPGALPIQCDDQGREKRGEDGRPLRVETFKEVVTRTVDGKKKEVPGPVKRQAARFRVFAYEGGGEGREVVLGETFTFELETSTTGRQFVEGKVVDVEWTVHLANKKASWYQFQETEGIHGYPPDHPLRNPGVTQPDRRRQLIIDPGPQTVSCASPRADFAEGKNPGYPQTFPPGDLAPYPIDTLGELIVNRQAAPGDEEKQHLRLIVLGGRGRSGTTVQPPVVTQYANNDGWFDDVSDGPVTARVRFEYTPVVYDQEGKEIPGQKPQTGSVEVEVPAWVVVGYPRYAPQILDMVTMDETMYDLAVRCFAHDPQLFGVPPFDDGEHNRPKTEQQLRLWRSEARYNPDYYPKFWAEIWPILRRPDVYQYTFDFDPFTGGDPHSTVTGGNLDPKILSRPPMGGKDPDRQHRQFIRDIIRRPGEENRYRTGPIMPSNPTYRPRAMPMMCGHNPLSNTAPQKFYALVDTLQFFLDQWAAGRFVNECLEWDKDEPPEECENPWREPPTTGEAIDRGVLSALLGSSFCPGGELTWIILNPAIYSGPYRIRHATYQAGALSLPAVVAATDGSPAADLAAGLEPGDLTKYCGIPWQSDFHACSTQPVNITYEDWNDLYLDSTGDPAEQVVATVPWWPAHRPIVVMEPTGSQVYWASGMSDNNAGNLRMVEAWKYLGFLKGSDADGYFQQERDDGAVGPPVSPGDRILGVSTKKSAKSG